MNNYEIMLYGSIRAPEPVQICHGGPISVPTKDDMSKLEIAIKHSIYRLLSDEMTWGQRLPLGATTGRMP